ncbi:MAG: TetR/AcrR family transcriptional regulator [Acidimicrobiales bacterium]
MGERSGGRTRLTPELRRAQIVEAAIEVFSGREPAEVTFEEIADAAGVSRALVYNYFGDRGGLVGAVCLRCFELLDEAIAPAFDPELRPAEQSREWVRRYLQFATERPGPWSLIGSASASQHPSVTEARRQRLDIVAERWGGTPEARIVAAAVSGMIQAAITEQEQSEAPLEFERFANLLGALAWRGLSQLVPSGAGGRAPRLPHPEAVAPSS